MLKVANDAVYLGFSKDKELLRVELLDVIDKYEGSWYVVYWESLLDFSNQERSNDLKINDHIVVDINSLSSKFGYKIFDSKRDAVSFIYDNEEFKVLR